jgi:hypothetical protein
VLTQTVSQNADALLINVCITVYRNRLQLLCIQHDRIVRSHMSIRFVIRVVSFLCLCPSS